MATRAQANTWYPVERDSRILFNYNHTSRKLEYWIGHKGAAAGGHNRRANLTIPQSMVGGQVLGGDFAISSTFDGIGEQHL